MTRQELFDQAYEAGINIKISQSEKCSFKIAIHLLNPTLEEVEDALNTAEKDMFKTIMIHTNLTWPK
jgi:hypothetical protein